MSESPCTIIYTISASTLSSRTKLLLIVLHTQASKDGNCEICLEKLSRLTSTSTRHLSRLLAHLAENGLIRISRRPGRCNVYILPSNYHLIDDQLQADWSPPPSPSKPQRSTNNWRPDPALVQAWQSAFSLKYQPVTPGEQKAMGYMLFANNSGQLSHVKYPWPTCAPSSATAIPLIFHYFSIGKKLSKIRRLQQKKKKKKNKKSSIRNGSCTLTCRNHGKKS